MEFNIVTPESIKPKEVGKDFWYSPIDGKVGYMEEQDEVRIDCEQINGEIKWRVGGRKVSIKELQEIMGPNNWKNAQIMFSDFAEKVIASQSEEEIKEN